MTAPSIQLQSVELRYAATAFRDRSLKSAMARWLSRRSAPRLEDIRALTGLDLNIGEGERVGILGHNGAGKSTLLKVVAGLYPLSAGTRRVTGAVRALFDLSLGFEPEATGRENIRYRGLLMGLTPRFLRAAEAEIVAFADLGDFIDYPLRTYSAGMQVRLAFAISTCVGGDILLLDEVIGAGDAAFMRKARDRIASLMAGSRIVLLATHDTGALRQVCTRALVLRRGRLLFDGPVEAAIEVALSPEAQP